MCHDQPGLRVDARHGRLARVPRNDGCRAVRQRRRQFVAVAHTQRQRLLVQRHLRRGLQYRDFAGGFGVAEGRRDGRGAGLLRGHLAVGRHRRHGRIAAFEGHRRFIHADPHNGQHEDLARAEFEGLRVQRDARLHGLRRVVQGFGLRFGPVVWFVQRRVVLRFDRFLGFGIDGRLRAVTFLQIRLSQPVRVGIFGVGAGLLPVVRNGGLAIIRLDRRVKRLIPAFEDEPGQFERADVLDLGLLGLLRLDQLVPAGHVQPGGQLRRLGKPGGADQPDRRQHKCQQPNPLYLHIRINSIAAGRRPTGPSGYPQGLGARRCPPRGQ